MEEHFEEMLSGERHLVCTYANGKSAKGVSRYRVVVYHMNGSDIQDEEFDAGFGKLGELHVRLDLKAIKAGLERIGTTDDPIIILTRLEYIPKYMKTLRQFGFRRKNGKGGFAANVDLLRAIAALDPENKVDWRFADRDYDEIVEEWKEGKLISENVGRAFDRDPY